MSVPLADTAPLRLLHSETAHKGYRYFGFGLLFALCYFAILYAAQRWAGFAPWLANIVGYVLIVPVHYLVHARYTFRQNLNHARAIPRQILWQVASCCLGSVLTQILASLLSATPGLAALIGTIVVNVISFVVSLVWVFSGEARDVARPSNP